MSIFPRKICDQIFLIDFPIFLLEDITPLTFEHILEQLHSQSFHDDDKCLKKQEIILKKSLEYSPNNNDNQTTLASIQF